MSKIVPIEGGHVDLWRRTVERDGSVGRLTAKEAELLGFLADRPGEVVSRDRLLEEVWGYHPDVETRAVDHTMRRLRAKVERSTHEPVHLHSVYGEGFVFRPRGPVSAIEESPGAGPGDLVGRADWLLRAADCLRHAKVVALVGPPGVGKSALVQQLCGAGFVLADVHGAGDPEALAAAIAEAASVDVPPGSRLVARVLERLTADRSRLVLDGLGSDGALVPLVERLRTATEQLVVTSRDRLALSGASVLDVPPLSPDHGVELLLRRAHELDQEWGNGVPRETLDALVRRVDALPLGIQILAASARVLAPNDLLEGVRGPLELVSSIDDVLGRLPPWARIGLAQLSAAPAGFSARAAQQLLHVPGYAESGNPIDVLETLIDRSLVRAAKEADGARFWVYSVVSDRLTRPDDVVARADAANRYGRALWEEGAWMERSGATAPPGWRPSRERAARRSVLVHATDVPLAVRLAVQLHLLQGIAGDREMMRRVEALCDAAGTADVEAAGRQVLASAFKWKGELDRSRAEQSKAVSAGGAELATRGTAAPGAEGATLSAGYGYFTAAWANLALGEVALAEQWARKVAGVAGGEPLAESLLGECSLQAGRVAAAIELFERSARAFREVSFPLSLAHTLALWGDALMRVHSLEEAEQKLLEAALLADRHELHALTVHLHLLRGRLWWAKGDIEHARGELLDGLSAAERRGLAAHTRDARLHLGVLAHEAGDLAAAEHWYGTSGDALGGAMRRLVSAAAGPADPGPVGTIGGRDGIRSALIAAANAIGSGQKDVPTPVIADDGPLLFRRAAALLRISATI